MLGLPHAVLRNLLLAVLLLGFLLRSVWGLLRLSSRADPPALVRSVPIRARNLLDRLLQLGPLLLRGGDRDGGDDAANIGNAALDRGPDRYHAEDAGAPGGHRPGSSQV